MKSTPLVVAAALLAGQIAAGPAGQFKDLETWSRYVDESRETERGVALVVPGSPAPLLVSFKARQPGRAPTEQPREIVVQVARGVHASPYTLPALSLSLTLDPGTPEQLVIDMSSRVVSDRPGPIAPGGDAPTSIQAPLSPNEFRRLASATKLRGNLFGSDVEFRADQIKALKEFFTRIGVRAGGISPIVRFDKDRFALGESVFFWIGVEAADDGLIPRAWQVGGTVTITKPDRTTQTSETSWPIDGMTDRSWRGGRSIPGDQVGTYSVVFQHLGQTTAPVYFTVEDVPVVRDIVTRFEFPAPLVLSPTGGTVTLVIENRSRETLRVPHRGGMMGHVTVRAEKADGGFSSSGFYPDAALRQASGAPPATSWPMNGYSWQSIDTVPTATIPPGETFRLGLPVGAFVSQQSLPSGDYDVTFGTQLDFLIGERGGPWSGVSPVRLDVRSTARGRR